MAPYTSRSSNQGFNSIVSRLQPSIAFIVIIFGALIAFEIFNFSTTEHALSDLLGNLSFAGLPWSTVLALAFCGIDFAGVARLFTPEQGMDEPKEVWYLFGAWLLAATMNAILTWWGVSMAIAGHSIQSSQIVDTQTIINVVPVFVAVMVWTIRILIIGTLSLAMDRLMHPGIEQRIPLQNAVRMPAAAASAHPARTSAIPQPLNVPSSLKNTGIQPRPSMGRAAAAQQRGASRGMEQSSENEYENVQSGHAVRGEPTYHTLSMSAHQPANRTSTNGSDHANSGSNHEGAAGSNRFRRS